MKPTVFIPEPIARSGLELLESECVCVAPWLGEAVSVETGSRNAQLLAEFYRADAIVVRLFEITLRDLEQCDRLKVIAKHGVGVDNIDCRAAAALGIPVVYTPAANANAVAEHTVTLMLALAKNVVVASNTLTSNRFGDRGQFQGLELAGKTLGVLGLGRIGSRVAQMAAAGLNMTVQAYDPLINADRYDGPATILDSLELLLGQADFLTLHVPLMSQTRHLVNDQTLGLVKPGCRIINTCRGGVIDESALVRALAEGKLAGAGLDVYETEPLPADHPLCTLPNVLLTPHIASSTTESLDRMAIDAAQGVLDVFGSRTPQYIINPEAQ